ncbi:MAG: TylF/MycF family methyltransferase [Verrucomicrobia bacterium]|nr:TylF/MycF family methyltransferase [Verrucomicrobiota bacterium]
MSQPPAGICHGAKHTAVEKSLMGRLAAAFEASPLPLELRLQNFPRHARRQDVARFLAKHELFQRVLGVHGSIVECGVWAGGGLLTWVHFSAIHEPYNHTRRVIGFDTFAGFLEVHQKDREHGTSEHLQAGALRTAAGIQQEIEGLAALHDQNRPLGHIPKVELVPGDACETMPRYVAEHPHLLISLLYLDFDLYAPTKAALEHLYPRVVQGGLVVFDELHCPEFPGETTALLEQFDLRHTAVRRLPFDPYISYFVK